MLAPLWAPVCNARTVRRGGWRMQSEAENESEPRVYNISRLGAGQLLKWCDGLASAMELSDHMNNEIADMEQMEQQPHPMVRRLADIGQGSHAHIGLKSLLEGLGLATLITELSHPLHVSHIVKPSTIIRMMHQYYPKFFERSLGADTSTLRQFWTEFLQRPRTRAWAAAHPALRNKSPADLVCMVPCKIHADSGPCSKTQGAQCVSWSSIHFKGGENIQNSFHFRISNRLMRGMREHGKHYLTISKRSVQELWMARKWLALVESSGNLLSCALGLMGTSTATNGACLILAALSVVVIACATNIPGPTLICGQRLRGCHRRIWRLRHGRRGVGLLSLL